MSVQVSYESDLELAMRVLSDVAKGNERVLTAPAPAVVIKAFADSGIDLELAVWVEDPERGKTNLRSEIYFKIWQQFKARGIAIPYPQREVRLVGATPPKNDG
jgi:small-conductance mechanosensitive channel